MIEEFIKSLIPETEEMAGALLGMGILFPCSAPWSSIPVREEMLGIDDFIDSSFPEMVEMLGAPRGMGIPFPCSTRLRSKLLAWVREEGNSPRRLEEQLDAKLRNHAGMKGE